MSVRFSAEQNHLANLTQIQIFRIPGVKLWDFKRSYAFFRPSGLSKCENVHTSRTASLVHACGKPLYEEENIVYSVFSSYIDVGICCF